MSHMTETCHVPQPQTAPSSTMSNMPESCQIWTSHVTCKRVMSHMNESCHVSQPQTTLSVTMYNLHESCQIWTSHVTCKRVKSYMTESCHIWTSHVTNHSHKQRLHRPDFASCRHAQTHTHTHTCKLAAPQHPPPTSLLFRSYRSRHRKSIWVQTNGYSLLWGQTPPNFP